MENKVYHYLCLRNEKDFRQERKTTLLFVEGVSDKIFLYPLLETTKFEYDGRIITLKIAKENIVSDFNEQASEMKEKSQIYEKEKYQGPKYEFVSNTIKTYENNSGKFNKIDCFGIIDKDFGHSHLISGLQNISDTKCHDRETTILRCCFPELIDDCLNKDLALDVLERILNVLVKQGIMEEISHTYNDFLLKEISHDYFKCEIENGSVDFLEENFIENYLELCYDDYLKGCYDDCNGKEYFYEFYSEVRNKITVANFKLMKNLPSLLKRWLIEKSTNEEDDKNLDTIFEYCNGHFVLRLMCKNRRAFRSEFEKEADIINYILDKVLKGKRKYLSLFEMKPFDAYKEYREKHHYFSD